MPKSRRNKVVNLTKTKKRPTSEFKTALVEKLQKSLNRYTNVFVFSHENMTTVPFRFIQQEWKDSKFFLGKNKIMRVALGKSDTEEYMENSHKLSKYLTGDCGLLLTNKTRDEVLKFFEQFTKQEYAKAGTISDRTIVLKKGEESLKTFGHSMEPYLRKLGLNTSLINTKIVMHEDYVAAEEGLALTPEQCKILKLLREPISNFKINVKAYWNKKGAFKAF